MIAAIIGIWLLIAGLTLFVGGIANHGEDSLWWVTMSTGAISIVLGIWALRRPGLTLSIIIVLVGIWAILMGTLEIAAAFEVKQLPKRFDKLAKAERVDAGTPREGRHEDPGASPACMTPKMVRRRPPPRHGTPPRTHCGVTAWAPSTGAADRSSATIARSAGLGW